MVLVQKMVVEAEFATFAISGFPNRACGGEDLGAALAGLADVTSKVSWRPWADAAAGRMDAGRRAIAVLLGTACSTCPVVASGSLVARTEASHAGRAAVTALTLESLTEACGRWVEMYGSWLRWP